MLAKSLEVTDSLSHMIPMTDAPSGVSTCTVVYVPCLRVVLPTCKVLFPHHHHQQQQRVCWLAASSLASSLATKYIQSYVPLPKFSETTELNLVILAVLPTGLGNTHIYLNSYTYIGTYMHIYLGTPGVLGK